MAKIHSLYRQIERCPTTVKEHMVPLLIMLHTGIGLKTWAFKNICALY